MTTIYKIKNGPIGVDGECRVYEPFTIEVGTEIPLRKEPSVDYLSTLG